MTPQEFAKWAHSARPGWRYRAVYHVGYLPLAGRGAQLTGKAAWRAYRAGLVRLVQERRGFGCYNYIAVKRRR